MAWDDFLIDLLNGISGGGTPVAPTPQPTTLQPGAPLGGNLLGGPVGGTGPAPYDPAALLNFLVPPSPGGPLPGGPAMLTPLPQPTAGPGNPAAVPSINGQPLLNPGGGGGSLLGGILGAVTGAAGTVGNVITSAPGAVGDAASAVVNDPIGAAGSAIGGVLGAYDEGRIKVLEREVEMVYDLAVTGDPALFADDWDPQGNNYGYNGMGTMGANETFFWLRDHPDDIPGFIAAYENGYDVPVTDTDGDGTLDTGDGVIDFTGARAGWEFIAGKRPMWQNAVGDLANDPLNLAGGVKTGAGAVGRGANAIRTADDATIGTKLLAGAVEGGARATGAVAGLADDPLHALNAGSGGYLGRGAGAALRGTGQGINTVFGGAPGRMLDYLTGPSARTALERENAAVGHALDQLSRTDYGAAQRAAASPPATAIDRPVDEGMDAAIDRIEQQALDRERGAAGVLTGPGAGGGSLAGSPAELGYLGPTNTGERLIDQFARDLAQRDPDALVRFYADYQPAAQKHMAAMDKLDKLYNAAKRRGVPDGDIFPAKTLASARHVVDDLVPLMKQHAGDEATYRFMNSSVMDPALAVQRDAAGKILNPGDVAKQTPNPRTIIEQAVFGGDDMAAVDARYWMRRQPERAWKRAADESKRLRTQLYGPDSVLDGKAIKARSAQRAATVTPGAPGASYADVFGDEALVQAERDRFAAADDIAKAREDYDSRQWMARQEAASLRAMGQPIPDDLRAILAEPPPAGPPDAEALLNSPWPPRSDTPVTDVTTGAAPSPAGAVSKADPLADTALLEEPLTPAQRKSLDDARKSFLPRPEGTSPIGRYVGPQVGVTGAATPPPDAASDALDRLVQIGDLNTEDADVLRRTVTIGEGEQAVEKRIIDVYAGLLADGLSPEDALRKTYTIAHKQAGTQFADWGRVGAVIRKFDAATAAIREHLMFNAITGGRGILSDTIGDSWSMLQRGDWESALKSYDPRTMRRAWETLRGTSDQAWARTSTGRTIDRLGLATPQRFVHPAMGREEVERTGQMSLNRFIQRVTGSEKIANAAKPATGFVASETIRDLRTTLDLTRRFTVYGTALATNLGTARDDLFRQIGDVAARKGLDANPLIARLDELGEFSPKDVRTIAQQLGFAPGDAEHLARSWRSSITDLDKAAMNEVNSKLFSYEATRADEVVKRVFLFHYWMSRATPYYIQNAIRNPQLAVNYYRAAGGLENYAEGKPRAIQGFLRLMGSAGGYSLFFNPVALASTALLFRDQAMQDGDDRLFDKVIKNSAGFLNPLLASAGTALGWLNDEAVDPTASYATRNTLGAVAQWAVSNGYLEPVGIEPHLLGTPWQDFLRRTFAETSGFFESLGLPGAKGLEPGDPQATVTSQIQAGIADLIRAEFELGDAPVDEWSPEAQQAYIDAITAFQDGKSDNPIANQALRDYSSGNLKKRLIGLAIPGGISLRQDSRDQAMMGAQAGDPDARTMRDLNNAGSPLATQVGIGEANITGLSDDVSDPLYAGGRHAEKYNSILYGTRALVFGDTYTAPELQAMSPEDRRALADAWLASQTQGAQAARQTYYDARDAALAQPINQPYAAARDWGAAARDIPLDQLIRQSPALQQYVDALPASTRDNPNWLAAAVYGPGGYTAAQGQRGSVYSPLDIAPTFDPSQADPALLPGGGQPPGSAPKTREQALGESIRRYEAEVTEFNQTLVELTGNPRITWQKIMDTNPMLRGAILTQISDAGLRVPSMPREMQAYQQWAMGQPAGADVSFAAFYRWADSQMRNTFTASSPTTTPTGP